MTGHTHEPSDSAGLTEGTQSDPQGVTGTNDDVILVVDDEADFAESVALWFRDRWTVLVSTDGTQAVEQYGPHVDVVLLDRRMPTVSGDEVLPELRAQPGDACIAMMSAVEPGWDIVDLDFDAYLQKPVRREEAVETVEELLRRREYGRDGRELLALGEKLSALRAKYSVDGLADDARYQQLCEEFHQLHRHTDLRNETIDDLVRFLQRIEQTGGVE